MKRTVLDHLGVSEADMPAKTKAKAVKRLIDRKKSGFEEGNAEFREAAAGMADGEYYDELSINDAQRLALQVQKCHGPRTASIRKRNGLFAVVRVSNLPKRLRKAKAAIAMDLTAPELYSQMGDVADPKEAD